MAKVSVDKVKDELLQTATRYVEMLKNCQSDEAAASSGCWERWHSTDQMPSIADYRRAALEMYASSQ
jgi:hypothetical protein